MKYNVTVVLYGCEMLCLTLREEHRLRVSENTKLRLFRPKREEVAVGWRKLNNEELHNGYPSPYIIRAIRSGKIKWVGLTACMGKMRNTYKNLIGKPEGNSPLERPRHSWENNKMDCKENMV
jgi:hypothetical protein